VYLSLFALFVLRAKNEAFLKKRVDRDDDLPTANPQATKKTRPLFRPASIFLKKRLLSSSPRILNVPRSLGVDLAEESAEESDETVGEAHTTLDSNSRQVADEEEENNYWSLAKIANEEDLPGPQFMAAANLMLGDYSA
jgi:hypothetical protein